MTTLLTPPPSPSAAASLDARLARVRVRLATEAPSVTLEAEGAPTSITRDGMALPARQLTVRVQPDTPLEQRKAAHAFARIAEEEGLCPYPPTADRPFGFVAIEPTVSARLPLLRERAMAAMSPEASAPVRSAGQTALRELQAQQHAAAVGFAHHEAPYGAAATALAVELQTAGRMREQGEVLPALAGSYLPVIEAPEDTAGVDAERFYARANLFGCVAPNVLVRTNVVSGATTPLKTVIPFDRQAALHTVSGTDGQVLRGELMRRDPQPADAATIPSTVEVVPALSPLGSVTTRHDALRPVEVRGVPAPQAARATAAERPQPSMDRTSAADEQATAMNAEVDRASIAAAMATAGFAAGVIAAEMAQQSSAEVSQGTSAAMRAVTARDGMAEVATELRGAPLAAVPASDAALALDVDALTADAARVNAEAGAMLEASTAARVQEALAAQKAAATAAPRRPHAVPKAHHPAQPDGTAERSIAAAAPRATGPAPIGRSSALDLPRPTTAVMAAQPSAPMPSRPAGPTATPTVAERPHPMFHPMSKPEFHPLTKPVLPGGAPGERPYGPSSRLVRAQGAATPSTPTVQAPTAGQSPTSSGAAAS